MEKMLQLQNQIMLTDNDVTVENTNETISKANEKYLDQPVKKLAKERITWLLVLMVSATVTGNILQRYEHAFTVLPVLVTFIPMLTDTGGNAGSQSSTIIIRGLALGEIRLRDIIKVLMKELQVSLIVGSVLSIVNFVRLLYLYPENPMIAVTVVLSLYATVIIAKTTGAILPIFAKKLNIDPAIMAAPLITTIVDALSLIVYFTLASKILGI